MTFQTAVVSEHTRQLVSETLQQVARPADAGALPGQEGVPKDDSSTFTESSPTPSESMHSTQGMCENISLEYHCGRTIEIKDSFTFRHGLKFSGIVPVWGCLRFGERAYSGITV